MLSRSSGKLRYLVLLPLVLWAALAPSIASAAPPDVMDRGPYTIDSMQTVTLGTNTFQEPNSDGGAATSTGSAGSLTAQIRGAMYRPTDRVAPSPVIMIVHGNHAACDSGTTAATATCTVYKRNDSGYAYMGENLASWGYTVFSIDLDQMTQRQDSNRGKGMHNRRILMAAAFDALYDGQRARRHSDLARCQHRHDARRQAGHDPHRPDGPLARW